jgi:L-cysteine:1D-myo-inositol 2-amino-2-deoxy-alpha-D-glucopyranoside ligase
MNSWADISTPPLSSEFSVPALSLMDTASQRVKSIDRKSLYRMYVCGITPYDATHLGHAATYLTFDLINRYLRLNGADVLFVQNITDIDDPLLERANRDGVDWRDLAQSQINLFRGDMVNLHILPPNHYIGVVEAMPLVISSIEKLAAASSTYLIDHDLYFSVRSDHSFGARSHLSQTEMERIFSERGGDPQREGKKDPLDALLWLNERPGEPSWPSPFGNGRPGWHIECCAIALNYLSPEQGSATSIDIQGGGSDLIFPHHEMSAAQGKILEGREFASHYVHAGMIGLNGEKMSKSLGNLVFVSKLIESGTDPMAIRWALMEYHYSQDRMWSDEILESATHWVERLRVALSRIEVAPTKSLITQILQAQSEDLNTPKSLSLIKAWIEKTDGGSTGGSPGELSRALDSILGIAL